MNPIPAILYVEDDAAIAEMYSLGLTRLGFELVIAPDWPTAREILQRRAFDLILLDIMLPGPDGMEALAQIRANPALREVPVAILSNSELSPAVHRRAHQLGILAWMTKSRSTPPQVARSIRRWLKNPQLTRELREA